MVAFGGAVLAAVYLVMYLLSLRRVGGWMCLWGLRTGRRKTCRGKAWEELAPIYRGWFYFVPVLVLVICVCLTIGLIDGYA